MTTTFKEPEEHTCYCCGHKGACHSETFYIGGQGYAQRWYCNDITACNERWDKLYMNLNKYLSKEHLAIGITLGGNKDFVWMKHNGVGGATWSRRDPLYIADVLHEADQILNWARSGIVFEKEIV